MMKKNLTLFAVFLWSVTAVLAQDQGTIKGKVIDQLTREPLPFVNVLVMEGTQGTITDENGTFVIGATPLGYITLQASFVGYKTLVSQSYLVTNEKVPYVLFELSQESETLNEVVVQSNLFTSTLESPLSVQSLGIVEIEKNPGGNRDILKVIQSLPGVASNPGFRNDIIIRGGAPFENKFYLDGVEVPVINHFQTQGATGGPVGIINADLIRKADFYASAFPASKSNGLSSLITFTQKDGNPDKLNVRATLGTSDAGITLDGPIDERTTFIASVRQSYLQFLFKALKLPFLPTYNDFQLKLKHRLSEHSELSLIGLGAIDYFSLNESVNDEVTDPERYRRNRYILSNIPVQEQWNYTLGLVYKHYGEKHTRQLVFSRNAWDNRSTKYADNSNLSEDLLLDYQSRETEHKLRFEQLTRLDNDLRLTAGVGLEQASYTNSTFKKIAGTSGLYNYDFNSELSLLKYQLFGQLSKNFADGKLGLSLGLRLEGLSYNKVMKNPFNQSSPRFSLTYALAPTWNLNASVGRYYQLPAYTVMGYRDQDNVLVNRDKGLKAIRADHYVSGLEFRPDSSTKMTLEAFYKAYGNYPFSVRDQISLANLGSDFGVIGNEEVSATSEGRAFGFELLAQRKSFNGLYGILAYTFVMSEFKDAAGQYVPSSWDNRHLLTFTGGVKLKKHWELGLKFRLIGGRPYTPYDRQASSLIERYDIANSGILDYGLLNTERYDTYHQLDLRLDKTWYWQRFSMNLYIDVQNLYASEVVSQSYLIPAMDAAGNKLTDPTDPSRYQLEEIENASGNSFPAFGIIVDF